jgi:hypothetical protein
VLALLGIAVAAIVAFVESGGSDEVAVQTQPSPASTAVTGTTAETLPQRLPPLIPLPGKIREEGGTLWWSSTDCRAATLDLSAGAVRRIEGEHCRVWPAPDGTKGVALTAKRADALEGKGLVLVGGAEAGRLVRHDEGFLVSDVVWDAEGTQFAVCFGTRDGVVVDVFSGAQQRGRVPGQCFPAWLPDGRLVTAGSDPAAVTVDGVPLLAGPEIERLLPDVPKRSSRVVSALAAAPEGTVAAALVVTSKAQLLPSSAALVVLSPDGEPAFTARLPPRRLPSVLGLAPDARGLWYYDTGEGRATVLSIPGGKRFPVFDARWIAWSPSGDYVAAATDEGIVLRTWPDGDRVGVIPVSATDVWWTRSAER